jgi:D-Tyr-tRNAtyr deacylase
MRAVIQRVIRAEVRVDGRVAGGIGRGLLVLIGIGTDDSAVAAESSIKSRLVEKPLETSKHLP